jgi:23S rRNA (cytosine1962-C5)-methyltransferase
VNPPLFNTSPRPAASPRAERVPSISLKKGSAKPLHGGHPWVFADAIARIDGPKPSAGDEVRVVDERGTCLGRGFYSPSSAIPVRLFSRNDEPITDALLETRIDEALALRCDVLGLGPVLVKGSTTLGEAAASQTKLTTAFRLINSEGDGLPGLIVDVYGDYLAVQSGTAGIERRLATFLDILEDRLKPKGMLDRGDSRARTIEQLEPPKVGPLRGAGPESIEFARVNGLENGFDLRAGHGQKTGLYLDQRENRLRCAEFARGRDVLDVFCYGGGFSLHAAKMGATSLTLIDSSEEALELAKANLERNGVEDADLYQLEWNDGFKILRDAKKQFGLIILDPPKFARSRDNVLQALSGYRDLNAQALRLLAPGGVLATCSCSGNVTETDFERAVAAAFRAAGRRATLLEQRGAAADHPIPPGFDQGRYLKCLLLQAN